GIDPGDVVVLVGTAAHIDVVGFETDEPRHRQSAAVIGVVCARCRAGHRGQCQGGENGCHRPQGRSRNACIHHGFSGFALCSCPRFLPPVPGPPPTRRTLCLDAPIWYSRTGSPGSRMIKELTPAPAPVAMAAVSAMWVKEG